MCHDKAQCGDGIPTLPGNHRLRYQIYCMYLNAENIKSCERDRQKARTSLQIHMPVRVIQNTSFFIVKHNFQRYIILS
jgi:hypothetical protein